MSGVDRIGRKGPTGPLAANGLPAPRTASGGPAAASPAAKDSVSKAIQGKQSKIDAPDDLPQAADAADLPAAVADFAPNLPQAFATLLEKGLPVAGFAGLRKLAERLAAAGIPGATGGGIAGEALQRLKLRVQIGAGADVVKPSDVGLVGISLGAS